MKGKTHPRLREFYRSIGDDNSIPFDHLTLGGRLAVRMNNRNTWDMMKEYIKLHPTLEPKEVKAFFDERN